MLSGAARWRRAAVRMLWGGLAVLGLLGFEALPHALLRPLENRYPVPPPEAVGRHVGVIVLGGGRVAGQALRRVLAVGDFGMAHAPVCARV